MAGLGHQHRADTRPTEVPSGVAQVEARSNTPVNRWGCSVSRGMWLEAQLSQLFLQSVEINRLCKNTGLKYT